ncbi:hypothetical protein MTX26_20470 [Bradyrhizobium sp. ISRA443]|uniref:hypothetical protein n=1 Tax=unclassified Bradyrhizobium TaxID=2631580 RepID=UPI00247A290A|nr:MULTISPECIES: hypothetical protein [unclassified Bradyrhizobium]WGR92459.1 hypothetical protein MTX20_31170 [Bradyrhizobium sp. ISRA435]WGR96832.1 hypothetical protein MTX23_20470 [Bradyrhizobium sp. ISRA436]WGS03720.1 hypothetical protein MTX18_20470 [Bradyrhizobium sp. ISRA437]WGS10604.1 hypothetical protein MTX26_20470 [Bradyrhizobium sp. ISRA443]
MFELVVAGVILLAVGYWATMFAMGRRDDVLHGDFVQDEPEVESVLSMPSLPPTRQAAQPDRDSLQALLTAIKRDLKDVAQI